MNLIQDDNPKAQVLRIDLGKLKLEQHEKRGSFKKASLKWKKIKNKLKSQAHSPRSPRKRTYFNSSLPAIKQILQKEQKNEEDKLSLYEHFKSYKFYNEFIEATNAEERIRLLTYLSKKFEYEHHEAGSVIIKQGELSNKKIYIVLSGRLQMRLQNKNIKKKEEEPTKVNDQLKVPVPKPKVIHKLTPRLSFSLSSRSSFSPDASIKELVNQHTHEDLLKTPSKILSSKSNHRSKHESKRIVNEDSVGAESFAVHTIKISQMEEHETRMTHLYGKVLCEFKDTDHFGEQALFCLSRRPGTVMAVTDVELASFDQPQFREVHKQVNESKMGITQLLASILPCLKNHKNKIVLESLLEIAEVVDFLHTRKLTIEGEQGEELFLVIRGQCELMKTVVYDKSEKLKIINPLYGLKKTSKEEIVIANVEKGSLIGDEILFNNNGMYEYTVTIISETAQFVKFNKKLFFSRLTQPILEDLESYSSKKSTRNVVNLSEKLEKKGTQANTQKLKAVRPIVSLPESIPTYSPNTHQLAKTPIKLRQQIKADVLNILLPKSGYQSLRNKLNNYQEGDEKVSALTNRPKLHINCKEVSIMKSISLKRKDSFTPRSTPRIASVAETPSITPAYSGACTPRRVISPSQKRRAISSLGKSLQRRLDYAKGRINATEKSVSTEQLSPKSKSLAKFDGTKTELNLNSKVLDANKEQHKNQNTQITDILNEQNTTLLEFLTARLIKSRITSRSIPNLKIQPDNVDIDDLPILEIQTFSSRERSRDLCANRLTSRSQGRNLMKPMSLTETVLQITGDSPARGKPMMKRSFSQALPKELFLNKNQNHHGSPIISKTEFQAPSVKGCSIVLAQS